MRYTPDFPFLCVFSSFIMTKKIAALVGQALCLSVIYLKFLNCMLFGEHIFAECYGISSEPR